VPLTSLSVTPYLEDASGYRGQAAEAFAPDNLDELREIVATAARTKTQITIAGAGTGLTGARVPHGGFVVSLERFKRLSIEAGRARCGAGVLLEDVHAEAAKARQFFGPNPTEATASVGGIISTNAGGARSYGFGAVRHHVLSLEVTFMDGQTRRVTRSDKVDFPVPALRRPATTKDSAGYYMEPGIDWVNLLSGSEGTLGIITEAELRLLPQPPAILSGVVFFLTDENALNAVDEWRSVPRLRLLEYMDAASLDLLRPVTSDIPEHARAALMVEQDLHSENDDEIDHWTERLAAHRALEDDSWFGFTAADRDRFRDFRHTLPTIVVERARRSGFPKFGTDFAVPLHRGRELLQFYRTRCEAVFPGSHLIFGHVGDANVHVNLLPDTAEKASRGEGLIHEFARFTVSLGGTVAAEHGIGKTKTDLLKLMYSPAEIDSMRAVKRRLDPDFLLGRGTIFEP
jgi:FAD/FMN-containing dehydrogenase